MYGSDGIGMDATEDVVFEAECPEWDQASFKNTKTSNSKLQTLYMNI